MHNRPERLTVPDSLKDLYVLPIADRWLLHAPLHGLTAMVNAATLEALLNGRPTPAGALQAIQQSPPPTPPAPHTGPLQPEFLGIIPTRACNLRCRYCGFGATLGHEAQPLDTDLTVMMVDWMAERLHGDGRQNFEIHFFGGEPFYAADVVDTVVHRARMRAGQFNLDLYLEVDTNGCFDAARCRFIGDYIDTVVLSFDGPEEIQNRHRPGKNGAPSFPTVAANAWTLSRMSCELCLRICVTQETVQHLPEISRWFCRQFRPDMIDYEPLRPTPESNEAGLAPPDPRQFAKNFMRSAIVCEQMGVKAVYAAAEIDRVRHSFCPVGRDTLILSPDGRLSACYLQQHEWRDKGLDLDLGAAGRTSGIRIRQTAVDRVRQITAHASICRDCFARWHCAGGCHVDHQTMRNDNRRNDFCVATRLITACKLLAELECRTELHRLLDDRVMQEKLVRQSSDRMEDWVG